MSSAKQTPRRTVLPPPSLFPGVSRLHPSRPTGGSSGATSKRSTTTIINSNSSIHSRSQRSLRVGVLGAATVLFKSWPALHSAGHRVTFIGCRNAERACSMSMEILDKIAKADSKQKQDVGKGGVGHSGGVDLPQFGSYDEVIHSSNVDVVYITIPVALRDPWVRACIAAGKHIVGEKPAAASSAQLLAWLEGCTLRRLLYMDGTMLTHSDRVWLVCERVRSLGTLKHIEANFSFLASDGFFRHDIRCDTSLEPHGALGDLGWYAIRWILQLVDFAIPSQVSGSITAVTPSLPQGEGDTKPVNAGGAIARFDGHLTFPSLSFSSSLASSSSPVEPSPVTATFHCSFLSAYQQTVKVFTSGGVVEVQGGINPTGEDRPHFLVRTSTPSTDSGRPCMRLQKVYSTPAEVDGSQQAVQLWRSVADSLMQLGAGEPLLLNPDRGRDWGRNAYVTQLVLDKLLESAMLTAADA